MTLGALQAIHEPRLRIPEDVAIVGFGSFLGLGGLFMRHLGAG